MDNGSNEYVGNGNESADIRSIVHMDWPFSVLDYTQENGRAGRDGLRSEAVMIVQEGDQRAADEKQAEAEQALVRGYMEEEGGTRQCRRLVLDGNLDGRKKRSG